jgi:hypothetical protein
MFRDMPKRIKSPNKYVSIRINTIHGVYHPYRAYLNLLNFLVWVCRYEVQSWTKDIVGTDVPLSLYMYTNISIFVMQIHGLW